MLGTGIFALNGRVQAIVISNGRAQLMVSLMVAIKRILIIHQNSKRI